MKTCTGDQGSQNAVHRSRVVHKLLLYRTCQTNFCDFWLVGWLVGLVLWHINLSMLFNAMSIFTQIISSISKNSV